MLVEPERPQHTKSIAGHVQEIASILGRLGSGLIDLGLDARPLQKQGDDRSSDPTATNQRFSCGSGHKEPFPSTSYRVSLLFAFLLRGQESEIWTSDLPSEDVVWSLCQGSVFDVSDELLYPCTLADLLREGVHAIFQESNGLKRGEVSDKSQASHELGVFGGWRADQDTQPVNQFSTSCLGSGVNGAFGMASFSPSFHWRDQREPVQRFDDSIEGSKVELHGRGKTALAHQRRHLIGMHRALGEQRYNGQRK